MIRVALGSLQQGEAEFQAIVGRQRFLQSLRQEQRGLIQFADDRQFRCHGSRIPAGGSSGTMRCSPRRDRDSYISKPAYRQRSIRCGYDIRCGPRGRAARTSRSARPCEVCETVVKSPLTV